MYEKICVVTFYNCYYATSFRRGVEVEAWDQNPPTLSAQNGQEKRSQDEHRNSQDEQDGNNQHEPHRNSQHALKANGSISIIVKP